MLIYNRYKAKVYNFTLQMLKNKSAAEDVVQNVFMKLYTSLNSIRDKEKVQFWIFKTARNEIYSVFRKKKIRNEVNYDFVEEATDILSGMEIAEEFEKKELKQIVLKSLEQLPNEQKEVFLLKEYGQLNYREISELLQIDVGLVKSRLYKTRQKLIMQISKIL